MTSRVYNLLEMATNFAIPAEDGDKSGISWLQLMLDLSHIILCCLQVRNDCPDPGFSRRYPLSTLVASAVTCLAGGLVSNFLLGLPLISDVAQNSFNLLLIFSCWYLVFFSPFDVFYGLGSSCFGLRLPLVIFKELGRAKKISKGISLAKSVYPGSLQTMLLIGTVRGCGSSFVRPLVLLFQGQTIHETNMDTFLKPSFTTKSTFLSCCVLLFAFTRGDAGIGGLGYPQIVFIISLLLVYAKVSLTLLKLGDPMTPFENLFCRFCFGKDLHLSLAQKKLDESSEVSSQRISNAGMSGLTRASTLPTGNQRPKAD